MDDTSEWQLYEISREDFETLERSTREKDFEKVGRSTREEEFIQTVMELLQGLDATRAKVIHLEPPNLAMHTRAIEVAVQRVGLPVIVKTLRNGMALALETDEDRARQLRQTALTQPPSP